METITKFKDFYDLTNKETGIKDKIFIITDPVFDEFDDPKIVNDITNVNFSNVIFKDCVFNNITQFVKCTFDACKFINCKWLSSLGFYKSEFFGCDIESMPAPHKIKYAPILINECVFRYCNFKDTKICEMNLWMTMFHYCRFPYEVYIISNGFETKFVFPDKNTNKENEQLINSLEKSFDPIPDEDEVEYFDETKFGYKEIKKEE